MLQQMLCPKKASYLGEFDGYSQERRQARCFEISGKEPSAMVLTRTLLPALAAHKKRRGAVSCYDRPVNEELGCKKSTEDGGRYADVLQESVSCYASDEEQAIRKDWNCHAGPEEGTQIQTVENRTR